MLRFQPETLHIEVPVQVDANESATSSPRHSPRASQIMASVPPSQPEPDVGVLPVPILLPLNPNKCVLSHTQRTTMSLMRNRRGTLFNGLPSDIMKCINRIADAEYDAQCEIGRLLHYVAYGNLVTVKAMLDNNPRLLLEAGHVEDPAGNKIIRVTPFECALGAGDDGMAAAIGEYFVKMEDGEKERSRQYARYQHHIDNMLKQPAYDFGALMQIINESSTKDVQAALDLKFNAKLPPHAALDHFREYYAPREIKGGMHFNYVNLLEAFKVYASELHRFGQSGNKYDKCYLFRRQVIEYVHHGLPAIDRMAFVQGLYFAIVNKAEIQRSFEFKYGAHEFPVTACDRSQSGLGFEFETLSSMRGRRIVSGAEVDFYLILWKKYVEQKQQACKIYAVSTETKHVSVCNMMK